MKLHQGDTVVVISGKDKGKAGSIMRVLTERNRVVVGGVNLRTRHIKKTLQSPGRIIRYEASLDASNVMLVDPKDRGKRTRVGYRFDERGRKERFAKKSGEAVLSGRKLKKLMEEELEEGMVKHEGKKQQDVRSGLPRPSKPAEGGRSGEPADPAADREQP